MLVSCYIKLGELTLLNDYQIFCQQAVVLENAKSTPGEVVATGKKGSGLSLERQMNRYDRFIRFFKISEKVAINTACIHPMVLPHISIAG